MKCPLCNIEAAIAETKYVYEQEEEEIKLFLKQDMKCRNPNCSNYNTIIDTVKNPLPVSKDTVKLQEPLEVTEVQEPIEETVEVQESLEETAEMQETSEETVEPQESFFDTEENSQATA